MNWEKLKTPLLYFSLGVNFAFLIILGFFYLSHSGEGHETHGKQTSERHKQANKGRNPGKHFYRQKIGVSDGQWKDLRPEMKVFHENSYELCKKLQDLHNKLLRLIRDPSPNKEAIETVKNRMRKLRNKKQRLFIEYLSNQKQHLNSSQTTNVFDSLHKNGDCEKHTHFMGEKEHDQSENHHE